MKDICLCQLHFLSSGTFVVQNVVLQSLVYFQLTHLRSLIYDDLNISPGNVAKLELKDWETVYNIIKQLNNKSSEGWIGIPVRVLKHNAHFLPPALKHISKLSISSGVFLNKLKFWEIIIIHKKESKEDDLVCLPSIPA